MRPGSQLSAAAALRDDRHRALNRPGGRAALKLQIICKKAMQAEAELDHGPLVRAARAIAPRLRICRNRLGAQPQHALAVRGFWLGFDAPARTSMEETPGLSRTRLSGRPRLQGSAHLRHPPRWRIQSALPA